MSATQRRKPTPRVECPECGKRGIGMWRSDWRAMTFHRECRYCYRVEERPIARPIRAALTDKET